MYKNDASQILSKLEAFDSGESWAHAAIQRTKTFLKLYLSSEIDSRALKFNLEKIRKIKNEYASYQDNLLKSQLDDLLNPIIDKL